MDKVEFSDMMKARTKDLAIQVIKLVDAFPSKTSYNTVERQIIRSATSTASNYRAVIRARSGGNFSLNSPSSLKNATKPFSGWNF